VSADRVVARLRAGGPPIAVFLAAIGLWEFSLAALGVKQFLLPRPSVIVSALGEQAGLLAQATAYTVSEVIGGLVIGCSLGVGAALAAARWQTARSALVPIGVAMSSIPIIAMAPITNIWFTSESAVSRMAIVAVLVFFPMMVNTIRGLTEVDPAVIELMRASAASELQIVRKIRVPNSLPFVFTGLKIATTLAVIGAVVGEYFGGPLAALGVYIQSEAYNFRYNNAWAAIVIACLLGIGFYVVVLTLERMLLPWHASSREQAT
jgi:NitT/TauT family transport system permease protein